MSGARVIAAAALFLAVTAVKLLLPQYADALCGGLHSAMESGQELRAAMVTLGERLTAEEGALVEALGLRRGAGETPPSSFENSPEDSQTEVTPLETTTTEAPPLPVGLLTQSTTDTASSTGTGSAVRILLSVLLLILLVSALPLRRMVILSLRNRRFEQKDTRKAVIAMYQTALEAKRYGAQLPDQLVQSAERAAFSQHAISAEEVEACRDQLYILLKSSYLKQNTWQKLRFKFLHALL